MSQKAVAEGAGVSSHYLGLLERGQVNVSLDTLLQICEALSVTPSSVLFWAERGAAGDED
jgi:transcriptional regulator with XRE-family HTH domain